MLAPVPVPLEMTPRNTSVTLSAMTSCMTRLGSRLVLSSSTAPVESSIFTIGVAGFWSPRAANTEYAAAMSTGATSGEPNVRLLWNCWPVTASVASAFTRVIPSRWASSAVGFTPTLPMSCAKTVLTEWTVADLRVIAPPPSPSTLCTVHDDPGVGLQCGYVYAVGAGYTRSGVMPSSNAFASVNGLNEDPGWRPPPPPGTQIGWSDGTRGESDPDCSGLAGGGHAPRARLTCDTPKSRPPTSALTNPVWGSTETSDISRGALVPLRESATDASASDWSVGSRLVWMRKPPRYTLSWPYLATRYLLT